MPSPTRTEFPVKIRFGGGMNTRASENDVNALEASDGKNFKLDLRNRNFRRREAFDLADTAPNGGQINGFAQLEKADGTVTTLVQAGTTVYSWDGSTFTDVGSVTPGAKIRGPRTQNYILDDLVVITDLAGVEPVNTWDGTTFTAMTHNLAGDFIAKYAFAHNDRMWYANVESNSVATPHLIVASALENYDNLSTTDRPASASGADDPFYLTVQDLKPINGFIEAFDRVAVSSRRGNIYQITGLTAGSTGDYQINPLYPDSGAVGTEPFVFIGNDIAYGRQGTIESLQRTDKFGDVESDDLSVPIFRPHHGGGRLDMLPIIAGSAGARTSFPIAASEIWVLFKSVLDEQQVSPWVRWTTDDDATFIPTAVMSLLDPQTNLEYIFFGDSSGNIYRLEGNNSSGDAGSTDIVTEYLTGLIEAPDIESQVNTVVGYIQYRKAEAATVTLTFEYSGESAYDQPITINIPAISGRPTYGGTSYYGGTDYYNVAFNQKLIRQRFPAPGQGNQFQVRVSVTGTAEFEINEIGLRMEAATP